MESLKNKGRNENSNLLHLNNYYFRIGISNVRMLVPVQNSAFVFDPSRESGTKMSKKSGGFLDSKTILSSPTSSIKLRPVSNLGAEILTINLVLSIDLCMVYSGVDLGSWEVSTISSIFAGFWRSDIGFNSLILVNPGNRHESFHQIKGISILWLVKKRFLNLAWAVCADVVFVPLIFYFSKWPNFDGPFKKVSNKLKKGFLLIIYYRYLPSCQHLRTFDRGLPWWFGQWRL